MSNLSKKFIMNHENSNHQSILTSSSQDPVKRHLCPDCPKSFHRSGDLIKHKRTHTGEKPFVCLHCSRAFGDSSSLSAHKRIHTGERPYQCLDCGKRFSVSSSLIKHRRIHTGERPYRCEICGRTFSDNSSYSAHRKRSQRCVPGASNVFPIHKSTRSRKKNLTSLTNIAHIKLNDEFYGHFDSQSNTLGVLLNENCLKSNDLHSSTIGSTEHFLTNRVSITKIEHLSSTTGNPNFLSLPSSTISVTSLI